MTRSMEGECRAWGGGQRELKTEWSQRRGPGVGQGGVALQRTSHRGIVGGGRILSIR